jgi:hypothetical protein
MGNAQWNLNTIAGIRTLGWTHVGHCVPMGAKQGTRGDQRLANVSVNQMRTLVRERREKDAKIGGPGRTRTSNQTVMSGPVSPENSSTIDVFRPVRASLFASVHGVTVVYLWSVPPFPRHRQKDSCSCRGPAGARLLLDPQGRGHQFVVARFVQLTATAPVVLC